MIDEDKIQQIRDLIFEHRAFRIGGRGICINFEPEYSDLKYSWIVEIPRASMSIKCQIIDIGSEYGHARMEFYKDMNSIRPEVSVDLRDYDKITRLYL